MKRPIWLITLFLCFYSVSTIRADQSDFFTAVQLFKLSAECPMEAWNNSTGMLPVRGLDTNQVLVDVEGITVTTMSRLESHNTVTNQWLRPIIRRGTLRINFLELPKLSVAVREPSGFPSVPPYYSLTTSCEGTCWEQYHNGLDVAFFVCDQERVNNAKIALETLIALAKAGDAHFAGLPQPPTTEGGARYTMSRQP
jgi:hypothetical protein